MAVKPQDYVPALSYEWLTPFYDTVVRLTMRDEVFKRALVEQADVKDTHRVLDLACGTGTLTMLLKLNAPKAHITGIDGDRKILNLARGKSRARHLEINFDEGMSFDLPYADASFDRVVSSLFFHHLTRENKLRTLAEVKRILKPDGAFHIADSGLPSNSIAALSSRLIQLPDGFDTTADNFKGLLPELMAGAGFEQIEETNRFNTFFGTIRLHRSRKVSPQENV